MKRTSLMLSFLLAATIAFAQSPQQNSSQQSNAGQNPNLPQGSAPLGNLNPVDSSTLKDQLDQAYQSEPSLTGSNIQVNVTDTSVELSGSVPAGKDKTTAKRIAQSYAGNRKVVEKLSVSGHNTPNPAPPSQNPRKQ